MYAFDDEKRSSKIARFFECFFFFFFFTYEISLRLFIHINVSLTFLFLKRNKKMDRLCGYINKIRLYNCVFLCFCGNSSKRRIIFLFNTTSSPKPFLKEFLNFCQSSFLPSIFHSIFYRFTDWNGDEIHSSEREEIFFSFLFSRISVNRLYTSAKIRSTSKKSHASTSFRYRDIRSIRYESIIR